jgi:hypothetical protein
MLVYTDVAVCVYAVLDVLSQCIFGVVLLRKAPPVLSDWGEENMQQVCACSSSRRSSSCLCSCLLVHLSSGSSLLSSGSSCLRALGESGPIGRVHPLAAHVINPSSTCHDTTTVCGCAWTRERHRGGKMPMVQAVLTLLLR